MKAAGGAIIRPGLLAAGRSRSVDRVFRELQALRPLPSFIHPVFISAFPADAPSAMKAICLFPLPPLTLPPAGGQEYSWTTFAGKAGGGPGRVDDARGAAVHFISSVCS